MTEPRTLSITVSVKFRWWAKWLLYVATAFYHLAFRYGVQVEVEK